MEEASELAPVPLPRQARAAASGTRSTPVGHQDSEEFLQWLDRHILGRHPLMVQVRQSVARAAAEEWPVLITGETGTGKDLAIHAIHQGSRRRAKPLHVVTMGGLGDTAWSVLFGHRRGSFTGAVSDHPGLFSAADGSSLALEDVADMPLHIQPLLLRAIEYGAFRPLGALEESRSNVRVLTSSNVPLEQAVAEHRFRSDLFQRISVLRIHLPPLREHLEDLDSYVPHFLTRAHAEHRSAKQMSGSAMSALARYSWPRNVRELQGLIFRASVEVTASTIEGRDIERLIDRGSSEALPAARQGRPSMLSREVLVQVLETSRGNKRETARRLGISPGTLYSLMRRHKIYG